MGFLDKVKATVAEAGDKVKAGVVEAGHKAKTLVEINRLKMQNNSKLNEIERQYQQIGVLVFTIRQANKDADIPNAELEPMIQTITRLQDEIQHNLKEIQFLSESSTVEEDKGQVEKPESARIEYHSDHQPEQK
ncbi:hypothetical protein [Paenibacillus sp. NEAU-GSW1]|uniref:hypothetical protein n=1 Tax=Paenibacillus sp. NEAU-GSW1 TaxID=2682486 RepID=UPI0012E2D21D|nr:hypothetical protein [Paenibacillus sp. NEAU-GSW1]MUT68425.1 hypothetical protein [Paenibacillus sp. NEAU-GSW1]